MDKWIPCLSLLPLLSHTVTTIEDNSEQATAQVGQNLTKDLTPIVHEPRKRVLKSIFSRQSLKASQSIFLGPFLYLSSFSFPH